mgnify:CR=1 FL=1
MDNPFLPFINMFYDFLKFVRVIIPIIIFGIVIKKILNLCYNNDNDYYSNQQIKNKIKIYIFSAILISIIIIILISIIMYNLK